MAWTQSRAVIDEALVGRGEVRMSEAHVGWVGCVFRLAAVWGSNNDASERGAV